MIVYWFGFIACATGVLVSELASNEGKPLTFDFVGGTIFIALLASAVWPVSLGFWLWIVAERTKLK
jgi:hypothetical protein